MNNLICCNRRTVPRVLCDSMHSSLSIRQSTTHNLPQVAPRRSSGDWHAIDILPCLHGVCTQPEANFPSTMHIYNRDSTRLESLHSSPTSLLIVLSTARNQHRRPPLYYQVPGPNIKFSSRTCRISFVNNVVPSKSFRFLLSLSAHRWYGD